MTTTVNSIDGLIAALRTAQPGDTVLLASGVYDAVALNNFNFSSTVTIASADSANPAVLSNLSVSNSSGLTFQHLDLTTTTGTAATVANSANITFSQDAFSGAATGIGSGMMVRASTGVTVTGSDFGNLATGVNALNDSGLTVANNVFHGVSSGAVRGTAVTASTISGNTFADANALVANHQDVVYLWQDNAANQVAITGNTYGPPTPAVISTAQQLQAALANAHAGDVLKLAGAFDGVSLSNLHFASGVTITSADPTHEAVFTNLTVTNSSGLTFDHVALQTTTGTAATVTGSQSITFSNDAFSGAASGSGSGMMVRSSDTVTVTNSDFGNFAAGINELTDNNVSITNNTFHGITTGAVRGTGVTNETISGNTFADAKSTVANHSDVINLWQDNTANHVTVATNTFGLVHTIQVNSAAQLLAALKTAHAGDVIALAAGAYDGLALSNVHVDGGVTITSADLSHHAVLSNLTVANSSGLTFDHLDLTTTTGTAATVSSSQSITFSNDDFSGSAAGSGSGMMLRGSDTVTVSGSDFGNFAAGINELTDNNVSITGNTFHGITTGAIRGSGVTNETISGNTFADAKASIANHSDVINLWQDNTANHVTIGVNTFGTTVGTVASTPPTTITSSTSSTSSATSSAPTTITTTDPSSGAHTTTVSSVDQLNTALKTAHAGDVIQLAAGTYNAVALNNLHFDGGAVTITSADQSHEAVINGLSVNGSSGLALDHLDVGPGTSGLVTVSNASNIALSDLTIQGSGLTAGTGVSIRGSTDVSVTHSDLSQLYSGMGLLDNSGITISDNNIHDIATDGIITGGTSNMVVSGNSFTDFHPAAGAHPDAIQFFAYNGVESSNILVDDNIVTRGAGDPIQGVFVENTNHIEITGNAMSGTMYNGISVSATTDALISDNFLQGYTDMGTWIMTRGASANVSVIDNTVPTVVNYAANGVNPNFVQSGNSIIGSAAIGDTSAMETWLSHHAASTASLNDSFFLH